MMNIVIDEKVKHRLIGITVILSIVIIFAPAMFRKSQQRIDDGLTVSVKLPPKPVLPKVAVPEKQEMFETIKVAHVEIPAVDENIAKSGLAQAQSLTAISLANQRLAQDKQRETVNLNVAKAEMVQEDSKKVSLVEPLKIIPTKKAQVIQPAKKLAMVKKPAPVKVIAKPISKPQIAKVSLPVKKVPLAANGYAVQLATFSQQNNAQALVTKLKTKGYQATYYKVIIANKPMYKVTVGKLKQKDQAQRLQQLLAQAVQIQGFIVSTGLS